ncbi:MAG: ACP S-malonyltransferase [Longimicrobiales bacterium]
MGVFGRAVVAFLFPGQGSQFVGMGRDLTAASAAARAVFAEADDVLGTSLSTLCFDGPESDLTRTSNAQPAILAHSVAALRALGEHAGEPQLAAGHSLGEFTAYVAAGALPFADALRVVRRRGELMEAAGRARPGTMAALIGLDEPAVDTVCRRASEAGGECVPANYNAPGQIVISGDVAAIDRAIAFAREEGARRAIRLNVSGAFHSPLMRDAQPGLAAALDAVTFGEPEFPVVSNVTAEPIRDAAAARRLLVDQLTVPVRWSACIETMVRAGTRQFLEIGPGSVLAGLLKRIARDREVRTIGTAVEVENAKSSHESRVTSHEFGG